MTPLASLTLLHILGAIGPAFAAFPPPPEQFSQPLECAAPEIASLDKPVPLRCAVSPSAGAATVVLFFRQEGAQEFTPAPTLRNERGWHVAWLCSHDLIPGPLQYYFEGRDGAGKVVAQNGNEDSPSVMVVQGQMSASRAPLATGGAHNRNVIGDDSDPLAAIRNAREASRDAETRAQRRTSGLFLGANVGVAHGYFTERALDFNRNLITPANFGSAGLPLWMPEIGWQFDDDLAASVQLRWQTLGAEGSGDPNAGSPAKRSYAILLRGHRQFGAGLLQPFITGNLGIGDGFRVAVPKRPEEGLLRDDTVRGGPFVLGPSAGALYHVNRHFALGGELRVLAGVPNFALAAELGLGAQVAF